MIRKNPYGFTYLLFFAFIFTLVSLIGCGDNKSSSPEPGILVNSSEGGTVTSETKNGARAVLDIPEGALPENTNISINIIETATGIDITISPENLKLYKESLLTIEFGDTSSNPEDYALFDLTSDETLRPLKQFSTPTGVTGTIYMLGSFETIIPDDGLLFEITDIEKSSEVSTEWQELLTAFNSLVWLGTYYSSLGDNEESTECMTSAIEISKRGIKIFLNQTPENDSKEYKNSLENIRYLMGLCDNPEEVVKLL